MADDFGESAPPGSNNCKVFHKLSAPPSRIIDKGSFAGYVVVQLPEKSFALSNLDKNKHPINFRGAQQMTKNYFLNIFYCLLILAVLIGLNLISIHSNVLSSSDQITDPIEINDNVRGSNSTSVRPELFITVKTTLKYHRTRVADILDTWYEYGPENILFVTDADDPGLQSRAKNILVTNCPPNHGRRALCCKLAAEYDAYLRSNKDWFCHFDDDNYVNVPKLEELLQKLDPMDDWYLGKSSTSKPIELVYKQNGLAEKVSFWFATGGAGFCLSKSLALKMAPFAANNKLIDVGERIRLPDDVTLGFVIEYMMRRPLTVVERFHSHLETMKLIPTERLKDQISLSAGTYSSKRKNVINVQDAHFPESEDPNRFKSIHCMLRPESKICHKLTPS